LDEIFDKLYAVLEIANDNYVDALVFPGDLFHNPAPTKNSHFLVSRWLKYFDTVAEQMGSFFHIIIVPGNHDLAAGRIENVDKQPIGILSHHPNVDLLHSGRFIELKGVQIAGVHWNYKMNSQWIHDQLYDTVDRTDVLVIHAAIDQHENPYYEVIDPNELIDLARVVLFGHIHPPEHPYGVTRYVDGQQLTTWISNPGALSRGSLTDSDLNRTPQVALIDIHTSDDIRIQYIPVPSKPATDVFRVEAAQLKKADAAEVERFVSQLAAVTISGVTIEGLAQKISEQSDDPDVVVKAQEILYKSV
jgi:DNA repair exonuclease SbcCD nuclease subunit